MIKKNNPRICHGLEYFNHHQIENNQNRKSHKLAPNFLFTGF